MLINAVVGLRPLHVANFEALDPILAHGYTTMVDTLGHMFNTYGSV
jgi:hypothetical protein